MFYIIINDAGQQKKYTWNYIAHNQDHHDPMMMMD